MSTKFKLQDVLRIMSKDEARKTKRLPNEMDLPWDAGPIRQGIAVALPQSFTSFMSRTVVRMRLGAPWEWTPRESDGIVQVARDSSIFDRTDREKKRMLVPFPLRVKLFGKLPDTREQAASVITCLGIWGGQQQVERSSDAIKALVEGGLEGISREYGGALASAIRDNEGEIAARLKTFINSNGLGVEELLLEPFRVGPDRVDLDGRKGGVITVKSKNEWGRRLFNYQAQVKWSAENDHRVASYLYRGAIYDGERRTGAAMLLPDQVEPLESWVRQLIEEALSAVEWSEAQELIADTSKLAARLTQRLGLGTGRMVDWVQITESDKVADRRFGDVYRFDASYTTQGKDQPIEFAHVVEYRVDDPELLQGKGMSQNKEAIQGLINQKVREWTRIWVTRRAYPDIVKIMKDEDAGQAQIRKEIGHLVQEYFSDYGIEITNFEALTEIPGYEFMQDAGVEVEIKEDHYPLSDFARGVRVAIEAAVYADENAGRKFERNLFESKGHLNSEAQNAVAAAVKRALGRVETRHFYRSRYVYGKNIPISDPSDINTGGMQVAVQDSDTVSSMAVGDEGSYLSLPDELEKAVDQALEQSVGLRLKPGSLNLRVSGDDNILKRISEIIGRPLYYNEEMPEEIDESQSATKIHLKTELLATDVYLDKNATFINGVEKYKDAQEHMGDIWRLIASAHESLTLANLDPEHLLDPHQQRTICDILSRGIIERAAVSLGVRIEVNTMFISVSQPNKHEYLLHNEKRLVNRLKDIKEQIFDKLGNPFEDEEDVERLRKSERLLESELTTIEQRHRHHRRAEAGYQLEQSRSGGAIEFRPTGDGGSSSGGTSDRTSGNASDGDKAEADDPLAD